MQNNLQLDFRSEISKKMGEIKCGKDLNETINNIEKCFKWKVYSPVSQMKIHILLTKFCGFRLKL